MQVTDFPIEIIIGDDNSSDGNTEICKTYAEKYPETIRLFVRTPDQKINVFGKKTWHFNYNACVLMARGKYIAIMDGDDFWLTKNKLQKQVDMLENDSNAVLSCSSEWNRSVLEINESEIDWRLSKWKKTKETERMPGHTSSLVVKNPGPLPKYLLKAPNFDKLFTNYVLDKGSGVTFPGPVSYHRVHETNTFNKMKSADITRHKFYDVWILFKHGRVSFRFFAGRLYGFLKW
jgi:glycosyltransferase involved in cell wall biosynthesis